MGVAFTANSCILFHKHRTKRLPNSKHTPLLGKVHTLGGAHAKPRSPSEHLQLLWMQRGQILPAAHRSTFCCCLLPTAKQSIELRSTLFSSFQDMNCTCDRSKSFPLSSWSCTSMNRCIYCILRYVKKHQPCIFVLYHPISKLEEVWPNPERVKTVKLHQQTPSERVDMVWHIS